MQTLFTSDLHIGHKNIHKYRKEVDTYQQNTEFMMQKLSELNKRTTLWVLGDFLFNSPDYYKLVQQIKSMPFQLKLVMGNHDSRKLYSDFADQVQLPLISYKSKWISHCPIHTDEMRFRKGNIHGHLHERSLPDKRYLNVNIDVNNYDFISLEQINEHFKD